MYNLLSCLEDIHKCGVVHRDLKPDNFLYDLETHKCLLIDFGLSEIELDEGDPKNKYNEDYSDPDLKIVLELQKIMGMKNRVGTRGFLAPEIIFNSKSQGKPVDIWAAGVIYLCFLSKRMPIFNLNKFSKIVDDTLRELVPLIIVFGNDKIIEIAQIHENLIYIPEIFEKFNLPNNLLTLVERDDIGEVLTSLIYRRE